MTVRAVFQNGVFLPKDPVNLPDRCEVEFEPRLTKPAATGDHLDRVYSILSQSFDTDQSDLAQRHDEHQP
jgi:predicted DNA-binding antitoxin AbrB/MazE fold protein